MPTQTSSALTGTLCQVTAVLHADRNSVQQLSLANIDPSCDKLLANATLTPQQANFALQSVYLGLTELLEQRYKRLHDATVDLQTAPALCFSSSLLDISPARLDAFLEELQQFIAEVCVRLQIPRTQRRSYLVSPAARQLTETGLPLTKDAFEAIVKPKETTGKSRKL